MSGADVIDKDRFDGISMGAVAQTVSVTPAEPGLWERCVRPAHPERSNPRWHVSPVIDIAAYHFSWVWVLIPMMLVSRDSTILVIYALVLGANMAHRHYGMPYAYLDPGVFRSFERKLTYFPEICILLFAATPLLLSLKGNAAIAGKAVAAIVFFAALWNIWHTLMQKFGIMRLYRAKDPAAVQERTPGWIDKYLILCWLPLYLTYAGPKYKDLILANGGQVQGAVSALASFMEKFGSWLVLPSVLIAAGGVGLWLLNEWRAQRFQNRARLSAALGTTLISTALLWANPVEAYIAFGFSHDVEYMVFVWAFQRRRYCRPQPAPTVIERLIRYPKAWYLCFTLLFAAVGFITTVWGRLIMKDARPIVLFGMAGSLWVFYYAVYESLVHFYMDGFLWKMRSPEVRANI
ncbi:MAG TPA: hypothetical protein VKB84_16095 [Candidatus Binataceae bacterium]|nr:hypothetical protein [Candidatus Binataceae bacterium]